MFWIQETGTKHNYPNYRLFYAEEVSDISKLPTNTTDGTQEGTDTVVNSKCALGSECICIANTTLYILTSKGWKEV